VRDGEAWVLAEDEPARSLGGALAWARQQHVRRVHLLAASSVGLLARRALAFDDPPTVWEVVGRALRRADPAPLEPPPPLDPRAGALAELIRLGGAEPVVEHGVLTGEVDGLEVCRVTVHDGEARLEVGVGAHDREAFAIIHGDVPPVEALAQVVAQVRMARRAGTGHPLERLARARHLRARLVAEPGLVGATALQPVPPPVPDPGLKIPSPAAAAGEDGGGRPLLVVCSVGVDLDLVPFAVDARAADGREGLRTVLVMPARDLHPVTRALAERLREPMELRAAELA